jgi:hypothetical protein
MSYAKHDLAERRRQLSVEISRQRTELTVAYRGLAKPIEYTQTGIKGFKFLKENAWAIALAPSLVSMAFSFFGLKKQQQNRGGWLKFGRGEEEQEARREVAKAKKPLMRLLGHGWNLFKFYRRVRRYFP